MTAVAMPALFAYLNANHIWLEEFGCLVALSEDRKTIFQCPMLVDGLPDRDEDDPSHLNWIEVTAPEPEFLERVNELFQASFELQQFSGR